MCPQASGARTVPGSPTAQDFYEAASDRVARASTFSPDSVELALLSPDRQVRLAANLYRVNLGVQGLDPVSAHRALETAAEHLDGEEDPRLEWLYHHLHGLLLIDACRFAEARVALRSAVEVASSIDGLEMEVERSKANALALNTRAGDGPRAASGLLALLREKESTALGPIFYQLVSYVLHWLGEFEFAYSLRLHGMQTADPMPARLVRDHREFARILISLGRLDEAEFHLRTALEWNPNATAEEAVRTLGAAVKYAAARHDANEAVRLLGVMRSYGAPGERHERAIVTTAQLLVDQGDIIGGEELLEWLDPERTTPSILPSVLSLRAEIAAHRGDHAAALGLFGRAQRARERSLAPAETVAAICRELTPWLSTAGPESLVPPVVESRFFDGSRWLMATARDMRRSMAPSWLALESGASAHAKLEVLEGTVDDLNLLGSFLADSAGPVDAQTPGDFWTLYPTAERTVRRVGATLRTEPAPGAALRFAQTGLAGRMAFGLISIIADHANRGSNLALRVGEKGFVIEAEAMTRSGRARVQEVVAKLCAPFRTRNVTLPSRASFVATYRAAMSLGWCVGVDFRRGDMMTISVDFGDGTTRAERQYLFAASPATILEPEPSRRAAVPEPDSVDPELFAAIAEFHDRRLEWPDFDLSLVATARACGDVDLLASTLVIASSAELLVRRPESALDLWGEFLRLTEAHPHLKTDVWPGEIFRKTHECWMGLLSGDLTRAWIAATEGVLGAIRQDSSTVKMVAALNRAVVEIDRGALASAWLFSNMCDPTRTSEQGRLLELGVQNHVLLAEQRFEEAVPVAQECSALAQSDSITRRINAAELHAKTMIGVGRFAEAWASVNDYTKFERKPYMPLPEALAAVVLWAEGRAEEAYTEAVRARQRENVAYGALTLTMSVPIEAEGLLARGDPVEARRVLDSFPIERQRYLDLRHRLDVEDRVAAALGDRERQIDVARQLLLLNSGVPRWDARQHPIYYKFWRTMEAAVRNDRQRIEAEQAAVATVVTHDLRNALAAVTLATEIASRQPDMAIIDRAGQALEPIRSLASQLDAVAQWDGSSRVAAEDLVDIAEFLDSIEFPNKSVYELSGGRLEVSSTLPKGLVVPTKRSMLAIILRNLVGNAIKHGRPDGTVRVTATAHADDHGGPATVIIAVDDDGPGLSADDVARLRQGSRESIEPSRGLGLWIVRRYSAALGLPLEVRTSELGGTSVAVHVKLPDRATSDPTLSTRDLFRAADPLIDLSFGFGAPVEVVSTRQRVMVVEDDPVLSTLVVELLTRQNKFVVTAATANEAIRLLKRDTFDVILTDIDLADGSTGYDVLASVYDLGLAPEVVVMSGQAIDQTRIDLTRRFGTSMAVLQKPFTIEDLYAAVGS